MGKTAYMFPGQGAQYIGMGKDFYENCVESNQAYQLSSRMTGLNLSHLCFEDNDQLNITEYTQIALYTTEMAMYFYLKKENCLADVHIGLSLGEYAALTASDVCSYDEGCRVVRARGVFMEHEVPAGKGTMAAVLGMTSEEIEKALEQYKKEQKANGKTDIQLSVANFNCPGQIVISGEKQEVLDAMDFLKQAGAKRVIELNVSGPFHSTMLAGAGEKLSKELKNVTMNAPVIPYMANVTANYVDVHATERDIKNLLSAQVSSSVRFEQSIRRLIHDGVTEFVEIGPGKTLTGFVKKIAKDMDVAEQITTFNVEKYEDAEEYVRLRSTLIA